MCTVTNTGTNQYPMHSERDKTAFCTVMHIQTKINFLKNCQETRKQQQQNTSMYEPKLDP